MLRLLALARIQPSINLRTCGLFSTAGYGNKQEGQAAERINETELQSDEKPSSSSRYNPLKCQDTGPDTSPEAPHTPPRMKSPNYTSDESKYQSASNDGTSLSGTPPQQSQPAPGSTEPSEKVEYLASKFGGVGWGDGEKAKVRETGEKTIWERNSVEMVR